MKFGFGGCCEKCLLFGVGIGKTFSPNDLTEQQKEDSLARYSLAPIPVDYVAGQLWKFEFHAESTWHIRSSAGSADGWQLFLPYFTQYYLNPAHAHDIDLEFIFYPHRVQDSAAGDLRLRWQYTHGATLETQVMTVTLESDWDDAAYEFGIGPVTATRSGIALSDSVQQLNPAVLADSIEANLSGNTPHWEASHGLRPGWLHRPIKNRIPRKLKIINNSPIAYRFNGIAATNIFDERRLLADRDVPKCTVYAAFNRWMRHNEPIAFSSVLTDREPAATPRVLGWQNQLAWSDEDNLRLAETSIPFAHSPDTYAPTPTETTFTSPSMTIPAVATVEHVVAWLLPVPIVSDAEETPAAVQKVRSVVSVRAWSIYWAPQGGSTPQIDWIKSGSGSNLHWVFTLEHELWDRGEMPSFVLNKDVVVDDLLGDGFYKVVNVVGPGSLFGDQVFLPIYWPLVENGSSGWMMGFDSNASEMVDIEVTIDQFIPS